MRQELLEMIRYSESSQLRKAQTPPVPSTPVKAAYSNPVSLNDEKLTNGRGLVDEDNVDKRTEFVNIDLVDKSSVNVDSVVIQDSANGEHETDWKLRMKDMLRPEMMRPLGLVVAFFFFLNASGISAMRPYFIKVFEKLNFPINPLKSTVSFKIFIYHINLFR